MISRDLKGGLPRAERAWPSAGEWVGGFLLVVVLLEALFLVYGWGELIARGVFGW